MPFSAIIQFFFA